LAGEPMAVTPGGSGRITTDAQPILHPSPI
jgi:hypothetical protein